MAATGDGEGRFAFRGVACLQYRLETSIYWHVGNDHTGGPIYKLAHPKNGEELDVVLTP